MQTPNRGVIEKAQALKQSQVQTVDGHPRSKEKDLEISEAVHRILGTADGETLFSWLRQITTNKVLGSNSTDGEIRYMEGMRMITALIEARRLHAEQHFLSLTSKNEAG